MKRLRVCVVTGTRAEFGIWVPVLRAIRESKLLELKLVVTGMHLLKRFGETVKEIEEAKIPIAARVPMYRGDEVPAESLARGVAGLAAAYREVGAELVMVLGDRLEMLAAASAALAERIPLAHVHGGETAPGIWDEQIRHAITKMAQVHFCATPAAGGRIVRMGEPRSRVHVVGAPALDQALAFARDAQRVIPKIRLVAGTNPMMLLHPSGGDDALEYRRAKMLIDLLYRFTEPMMVRAIGPNNDPGHKGILKAIGERPGKVFLEASEGQSKFWLSLISSGMLVGNSSSGIIEAATFGIPVVNIGTRQAGRERSGNVIDVAWEERAIAVAVERAISDKAFLRQVARRRNVYGDGKASGRIIKVLEGLARKGLVLEKRFVE